MCIRLGDAGTFQSGALVCHYELMYNLSYIYLGSSVCHIPVCHPVTIAERSAILLVLIIKLTQETGGGIEEGGIKDGEIGKGQIGEGGCE